MANNVIVLFHYSFSPYARRVIWYLNLRRIPFTQCIQPITMPRPDLAALGVSYRRIPILSIGRDIYLDTRLIISKLDSLFPPSPQHPGLSSPSASPEHKALEQLLQIWAVDGGLFTSAAALIPPSAPVLNDSKFVKDREDYTGRSWSRESVERQRPGAIMDIRRACEVLETTLLADGRKWILGGEGPGLADIEVIWPFHWLKTLPNALPSNLISPSHFPLLFAYISRFDAARKSASQIAEELATSIKSTIPRSLTGPEVLSLFQTTGFNSQEAAETMVVDANDPSGLQKGDEVEVSPSDSGFTRKDRGKLLRLDGREIVIEGRTEGDVEVRIHAPRHGFRVRRVKEAKL